MLRKVLLWLAILVGLHGALFGATAWLITSEGSGEAPLLGLVYFFGVVMPAMLLAVPFKSLLWGLHLMETPGWFAWPRPLGFALVYAGWVLALLAAAYLAGALARRSRARPTPPSTAR